MSKRERRTKIYKEKCHTKNCTISSGRICKSSKKKYRLGEKTLWNQWFSHDRRLMCTLHQRTATGANLRTNFVGVLTRSICPYTVTVSNYTARWPDWSHAKISVRWQASHLRERYTLWETRKTSYDERKKRKRERTGWPLDDLKSVQYFILFSSAFFFLLLVVDANCG